MVNTALKKLESKFFRNIRPKKEQKQARIEDFSEESVPHWEECKWLFDHLVTMYR